MNKKWALYALVPAMGLTFAGVNLAAAHGWYGGGFNTSPEDIATHQAAMFQSQSSIFGLSVDEIKNAWADGKDLRDIAKEKGMTDEQIRTAMANAHKEQMRAHLQALVDKGIITQDQADRRTKAMETRLQEGGGKRGPFRMHGGPMPF